MVRYVMLLNFTDKGIANIKDSTKRGEAFKAAAARSGATVEAQFWTLGTYDGVAIFSAPDELKAAALALELGQADFVRTTLLRAFDQAEFLKIVTQVS
jgi:uncharacterized protein with GYD domain